MGASQDLNESSGPLSADHMTFSKVRSIEGAGCLELNNNLNIKVNKQDIDDIVNIEDVEDADSIEEFDDGENIEDIEDGDSIEELDDGETIEDLDGGENIEELVDIENVEELDDIEKIVDLDDIKDPDGIEDQAEKPVTSKIYQNQNPTTRREKLEEREDGLKLVVGTIIVMTVLWPLSVFAIFGIVILVKQIILSKLGPNRGYSPAQREVV